MEKKTKPNEVKIELTLSGMPEENVRVILEFDHRTELDDRYYEEAKDIRTENRKVKFTTGEDGFRDDPIDCLPDMGPTVHEYAFPERKELDPRIEQLTCAMQQLTPTQRDLIYDIYGSCRSLEEIAAEDGVSRQAIYNRKDKILKRLRKLMEVEM